MWTIVREHGGYGHRSYREEEQSVGQAAAGLDVSKKDGHIVDNRGVEDRGDKGRGR